MTNKELLEDLLIEFDELDMQPMILIPNPLDRAKSWKHELTYAIKHLKADVAREIFEEIERLLDNHHSACLPVGAITPYTYYEGDLGDEIADLKKKYTEGE